MLLKGDHHIRYEKRLQLYLRLIHYFDLSQLANYRKKDGVAQDLFNDFLNPFYKYYVITNWPNETNKTTYGSQYLITKISVKLHLL